MRFDRGDCFGLKRRAVLMRPYGVGELGVDTVELAHAG